MLTNLTQGHLKQLEVCPRKFQYGYLEQLTTPTHPEMRQSQEWGTRFHRVMQQQELGLSVAPLLAADVELAEAVNRMVKAAPELFQVKDEEFRQSEHRRTLAYGNFLLTVVYDLLIMSSEGAQIVDWKTYLKPQGKQSLEADWQTRLYLYVLAETTDFEPQQLAMKYWFVRAQDPTTGESYPTQVTMSYSAAKHHQTGRDLKRLTDHLAHLITTNKPYPKVNLSAGHCCSCPYAIRCQRPSGRYPSEMTAALPAIDEIAEISL
jgi:hypothetical protein